MAAENARSRQGQIKELKKYENTKNEITNQNTKDTLETQAGTH